jgi:hypothetical protein
MHGQIILDLLLAIWYVIIPIVMDYHPPLIYPFGFKLLLGGHI